MISIGFLKKIWNKVCFSSCMALILFPANIVAEVELQGNAITYGNVNGRFGDCLLHYMRAKWLSYCYNLPLLYKPFAYSDQLMLHVTELHYDDYVDDFEVESSIRQLVQLAEPTDEPTIFHAPYLYENIQEHHDFLHSEPPIWFLVDWEDPAFRAILREVVAPRETVKKLVLPDGVISVALHIRSGGGFDSPHAISSRPLLFLPLSWYCEQLEYMLSLCGERPVYVYIFTDDPNTLRIQRDLKSKFPDSNVTFDCRSSENSHNTNVVEDLFFMAQFDCLIRPSSYYSSIAGVIGKSKMEIFPISYKRNESGYSVDKVQINFRGSF